MDWYKHYIGDYQRDTGHLSLAEHGAYRTLLDHYYATERGLPSSIDALCRLCRAVTKDEQASVRSVVDQFFHIENGIYKHGRVEREIERAEGKRRQAQEAGAIGGSKRKGSERLSERLSETEAVAIANDQADGEANGVAERKQRASAFQTPDYQTPEDQSPDSRLPEQDPSIRSGRAPARKRPALVLPDWLEAEKWAEFKQHRIRKRAPMTERAQELAIDELGKLREQGHDPGKVIDQSIYRGWTGLFPVEDVKPQARQNGQQWPSLNDEKGWKAKGAELGIHPKGGESWDSFRARVRAAATQGAH